MHDDGRADDQRSGHDAHHQPIGGAVDLVAEALQRGGLDLELEPPAARHLQQSADIARQVADQVHHPHQAALAALEHGAGRVTLPHHPFQVRARGTGHVELRVELAAHPFQGQEGLDHQGQIGRQGQRVLAQQLGDVAQHQAHVQVLERHPAVLVDERADVLLQPRFVHLHATGPVQQDVGHLLGLLRDQAVQELGDLEAALFGNRADHAEIDHADPAVAQVDDVARVRVGVETAILEHHLEHDARPGPGQLHAVQAGCIDTGQVAAGNAINEVLHVEAFAGPPPVHVGNQDVVAALEVARDAFGIAAFGGKIQLAAQ